MVIFTSRMKIGNKGLFCSPRISLVLYCTSPTAHSIATSHMVVIVTGHLKRGKKKVPLVVQMVLIAILITLPG